MRIVTSACATKWVLRLCLAVFILPAQIARRITELKSGVHIPVFISARRHMLESRSHQVRENLKRLISIHSASMATLEESIAILESELNSLAQPDAKTESPPRVDPPVIGPRLNAGTLSVEYGGKQCVLGNTLKFKLLARLLRRPNQYVSYDTLLTEVWMAVRDASSIRSVVKELRAALRASGMDALADVIDGHTAHHYGLFLSRLP